jgi:fibronectin type 3 domain-containing protein
VKKTTGVKVANAVAPKTVTGLTNGTTYYVVVTAANSSGESGESGEKSVIPIPALQPPDKPSGVSAAGGNQQVVLGWSEVPNATAYNIYYRTSPGVTKNNGIKVAGVTAPYTVTGLSNGVTYYFVVTAVNSAGEGPESSEKYATPLATPQPPPKPSGIIVSGGDQKVTVQWNAVPTATYYNIYYSTSPGVTKTNGLTIPNVTSPRVVTGLTNGTPYYFVVTAGNAGGEGAESSEKSATPAYIAPPGSPTGVAATAGSGKVTVSWAAVATATSYNIYYSSAYTITADLLAHGTKFSNAVSPQDITGLSAGTKYYFVVTAVNAGGESGGQNTPKNATPTP